MATTQVNLPDGFVLDQPKASSNDSRELPEGFVVDTPRSHPLVGLIPAAFAFSPEGERVGEAVKSFGASLGRKAGNMVEGAQNAVFGPPRPRIAPAGQTPRVIRPSDFEIGARTILPAMAEAIPTVAAEFFTPKSLVMGAATGAGFEVAGATRLGRALMSTPIQKLPGTLMKRPSLDQMIDKGITKAIRPSVGGTSTAPKSARYYGQAREAVKAIAENPSLQLADEAGQPVRRLPESLQEFSEAIDQTKQAVFQQYNALAKQAGQQGIVIDLAPIAREVELGVTRPSITTFYPEVQRYGMEKAASLKSTGHFTPEDAQDAIKLLNKSLEAYYKNPSPETASRAVIDAGIVNNLRRALDTAVDAATGQAYQPLKRTYGALTAIEKDVGRRAIVHARRNVKGLIDFSDIISGGNIARGILTLNPGEFATGVAQKGIANYLKMLNNPDRMVRSMFREVGKTRAIPSPKYVKPTIVSPQINGLMTRIDAIRKSLSDARHAAILKDRTPTSRAITHQPFLRIGHTPRQESPRLGYDPIVETSGLGTLSQSDPMKKLDAVNQQLLSLSRMLEPLRIRAQRVGGEIKEEVAYVERQLQQLFDEQAALMSQLQQARRLSPEPTRRRVP